MLIDLTKLTNNLTNIIDIEQEVCIDNENLKTTDIKKISPIKVKGYITKNDLDILNININIKGQMTLPCAITLKDVEVLIEVNYENDITEDEENLKITNNNIDIIPIIWENIFTEIPIRVISPNAKLEDIKTDGFEVIYETKSSNQFEVLKDLLKEKEDE